MTHWLTLLTEVWGTLGIPFCVAVSPIRRVFGGHCADRDVVGGLWVLVLCRGFPSGRLVCSGLGVWDSMGPSSPGRYPPIELDGGAAWEMGVLDLS